ncbi:MAG: hypothetical protein EBZ58_10200, partial [Bacteroidetes bacterium]|nr:hypothetical protein [Bacteroidota bacterium]
MKKQLIAILFLIAFLKGNAQTIVAGPMLGYAEHTESLIWLQVKDVQQATISYVEQGKSDWKDLTLNAKKSNDAQVLKFVISGLKMGAIYQYKVLLDAKVQSFAYPLAFKTKKLWEWRTDAPDFS